MPLEAFNEEGMGWREIPVQAHLCFNERDSFFLKVVSPSMIQGLPQEDAILNVLHQPQQYLPHEWQGFVPSITSTLLQEPRASRRRMDLM